MNIAIVFVVGMATGALFIMKCYHSYYLELGGKHQNMLDFFRNEDDYFKHEVIE